MILSREDRSAWLADASQTLQDRADERRQRRTNWLAAGADPATDPARTSNGPEERASVQLHRRRAAAVRCEPLPDGRRDPFDPPARARLGWEELDRCAAALLHLQREGLPGLPSPDVAQALARYPDRYSAVLPHAAA